MSEEERALDRQRQVQEKLAAAAEAYYSGSLEKAAKLAQDINSHLKLTPFSHLKLTPLQEKI